MTFIEIWIFWKSLKPFMKVHANYLFIREGFGHFFKETLAKWNFFPKYGAEFDPKTPLWLQHWMYWSAQPFDATEPVNSNLFFVSKKLQIWKEKLFFYPKI